MKSRPNGATDVTEYFVMRDSTTHAPKTDVTITDIDIYYQEQGAAQSAKADLTALAAANSAHADNKGYHCGNAVYRIDWPDAAFDGGAGKSVILIVVCTGCDTIYREIQLSPPVDVASISGDSTAADNLEAAADGSGYNLGGGDIVAASVTTVSDKTGYALTSAYDAAKSAAPETGGNIAAILADTDELQTNQGNWTTATGFSTHSAADVVTELGTGSTLTACATATGFSTHSASDVVTALGTGSTLTACATATGFSTHSANDAADALLGRNIAGGSSTGRLVKDVFRLLRNKVTVSGGTMTVCQEDDTTEAWTASVTSDSSADPITTVDPT